MYCDVILRHFRVNVVTEEEHTWHILSVCVCVALVIQHAVRMRIIIVSSAACLQYRLFSHYFIKETILGKKKIIEHKMLILVFCTTSIWKFLILSNTVRNMLPVRTSAFMWSTSCTPIRVRFYSNVNVIDSFLENPQIPNFMQNSSGIRVVPCGRKDRQTDIQDITNSRFSQFCELVCKFKFHIGYLNSLWIWLMHDGAWLLCLIQQLVWLAVGYVAV